MHSGLRIAFAAGTFAGLALNSNPLAGQEQPPLLQPTTVILVRHAEKSVPEGDHPLSGAGRARARELARVLRHTKISAIYTTQFMRTRQTAEPLAKELGLAVQPVVATATYVTDMLDRIRQEHTGEAILIVSHRNTVPALIEALGVSPAEEIIEEQYDHIYVVTVPPAGAPTMLTLRYGRSTPHSDGPARREDLRPFQPRQH
jgi:broad specificity phosphatase PhoE